MLHIFVLQVSIVCSLKYLVKFKSNVSNPIAKYLHSSFNTTIKLEEKATKFTKSGFVSHKYEMFENTFILENLNKEMIQKFNTSDDVEIFESDKVYRVNAEQHDSPWGLARISTKNYFNSENRIYRYNDIDGTDVDIFVIDTGINIQHSDFGNRARWGANFVNEIYEDDHGHGTHVAGICAGEVFGVSKKSNLIAVKALDSKGAGEVSTIIKAIEWVILNKSKKSVLNMSVGGRASQILNYAVSKAIESGVVVVVAAGNDGRDACGYSPASYREVISVGAIDYNDKMAKFSNYGECVTVMAPGVKITSAWAGGTNYIKTISGTSMASPHVAGLAAYFLSQAKSSSNIQNPHEYIKNIIVEYSTKGKLKNVISDTPNCLAFNNYYE